MTPMGVQLDGLSYFVGAGMAYLTVIIGYGLMKVLLRIGR
jgi:hypothetical protein